MLKLNINKKGMWFRRRPEIRPLDCSCEVFKTSNVAGSILGRIKMIHNFIENPVLI